MSDFGRSLPRERLDALNGWKSSSEMRADNGLLPEGDFLLLTTARDGPEGALEFDPPVPDTDPRGSFGGRSLPRGVALSETGDIYLADPDGGRVLYTRAANPPEADPAAPEAPFVPLWSFEADLGDHPLNLGRPVDLALVSARAKPAAFADCLVIADAERGLVLWVDRRQIITRHMLRLSGVVLSVAVAPCGQVAVLSEQGGVYSVTRVLNGDAAAPIALEGVFHTVLALADGSFVLAGSRRVEQLGPDNRLRPVDDYAEAYAAPFILRNEVLYLPGVCDKQAPLALPTISVDGGGYLRGTSLGLITRPRRLPRPRSGHWISQSFDGASKGFAWDRVALEAVIPDQCRLLVSSFVSDIAYPDDALASVAQWSGQTVLDPGMPTELLVQRNKGRYLRLKIEAFGEGTSTPAISGIDIFGPRDSQLSLLPAPFHQDPLSADFLDRFLSLQDGFLGEALQAFSRIGAILTPEATPKEFIDWLGGWFDWEFLQEWDATTRREMIALSMQFFAERGTIAGLERLLRWHTGLSGALPMVLEDHRLAQESAPFLAGTEVEITDGGAHRFIVVVPHSVAADAAACETLNRVIAAQKPAHTAFRLCVVEPGFIPGTQARLGVDAILPDSRPPPLGEGRLDTGLRTVATC